MSYEQEGHMRGRIHVIWGGGYILNARFKHALSLSPSHYPFSWQHSLSTHCCDNVLSVHVIRGGGGYMSYAEEDTCHMLSTHCCDNVLSVHVIWGGGGYMSYAEEDTCHMLSTHCCDNLLPVHVIWGGGGYMSYEEEDCHCCDKFLCVHPSLVALKSAPNT